MRPRFFVSTTLILMVALCAIDWWLSALHPLAHAPTAGLDRGECFNAVKAYENDRRRSDLVLLGSSLMTVPIMQAEAIYLQHPISRMEHRHCQVLENLLKGRLGQLPQTFCLALGGEMVSDAYLLVEHQLKDCKQPDAIVYGIAPRDFQDNLMPGITSSEAFQVLARMDDLGRFLRSNDLSPAAKGDLILGRIWALWRYRSDIRVYLCLRLKKLMESTLPFVVFDKYAGNSLELKPVRHGQFPEEALGELMAWPGVPLEHVNSQKARFEYIRRYNPLSPDFIESEFGYLEKLLKLCQARGISVVLINMPLSQFNKSLIPHGFYHRYLNRATSLCHQYHAELFDLDHSPWDTGQNFIDTVHLTPAASTSFIDALSQVICQSRIGARLRSLAAINPPPPG